VELRENLIATLNSVPVLPPSWFPPCADAFVTLPCGDPAVWSLRLHCPTWRASDALPLFCGKIISLSVCWRRDAEPRTAMPSLKLPTRHLHPSFELHCVLRVPCSAWLGLADSACSGSLTCITICHCCLDLLTWNRRARLKTLILRNVLSVECVFLPA